MGILIRWPLKKKQTGELTLEFDLFEPEQGILDSHAARIKAAQGTINEIEKMLR